MGFGVLFLERRLNQARKINKSLKNGRKKSKQEHEEWKEKHKQEHEKWKKKNALALHAIQLSCGPAMYSKFEQAHISAEYAWNHLVERAWGRGPGRGRGQQSAPILDHDEESPVEDNGSREHLEYKRLYELIEEGNWHDTRDFLQQNPQAKSKRVSSHGDTALHIATLSGHIRIAEKLVKMMDPKDLEQINGYGATALTLAAICGATKLAKAMVQKNKNLVTIANPDHKDGQLPVIVAALYGQKQMVRYLYKVTPKDELSPEKGENEEKGKNGATLLNCLITAEIYDVALMLLKRYQKLGVTQDHSGNYTLRILAHKPSAFPSGTKLTIWEKWIYYCLRVHSPWDSHHDKENVEMQTSSISDGHINIEVHESSVEDQMIGTGHGGLTTRVPEINHIHHRKLVHVEVLKLLSVVFEEVRHLSKSQLEKMDFDKIIYDSVKHGILELIEEMIKYKPDIIWREDKKGRAIFSHAIVLRQENIFSLIYTLGTKKSIMARRHDIFKNNYLHLAAKLSPPSQLQRVSGAALQMQRELQWFKEVESIVQPKLKEEVNEYNKTPEMLFTDEHKKLAKEAESWMKSTAGSSMIVGTLIAAVMFTTAFTVPGGNKNDTGMPTMLETQRRPFMIFMVSNALSMFSSSTSLLMFLGIHGALCRRRFSQVLTDEINIRTDKFVLFDCNYDGILWFCIVFDSE